MKINVNGRTKDIGENITEVDYDDVVRLAYAGEDAPRALHTITYEDGINKAEGSLLKFGLPIPVCEGMIFNCIVTDNS